MGLSHACHFESIATMKVTAVLLVVLACTSVASAAISIKGGGGGGAPDPKTSPPLCDTIQCGKTCCTVSPAPVYSAFYCDASKKCAWKCLPDTIPCGSSCYKVPYPGAVGWCQDGNTFKWACKSFSTLCKGKCRPYPSDAVNVKCDPATGKLSFECGMDWVKCDNACCDHPVNGKAICAMDPAKNKRYCTFQCKPGYKYCYNFTKCCKA